MLTHDTKIRVCYGDTDKMGVVYYGVYPRYYEIGRTEMIRELWKSYASIEAEGVLLPARSLNIEYFKPAAYDELLTVRTIIREIPGVKFVLETEIYNENEELINRGKVVLVFTDASSGKPRRIPNELLDIIQGKWADKGVNIN